MLKALEKQTKITALATIACLIVAIILSVDTVKYYTQKKATVSATISQIEMYDHSNGETTDTGYSIYVDYVCMGKTFHNVFFKNVKLDNDIKVGDKVEVEVYANNPGEVAGEFSVNSLFFFAAFIVLCVISVKKIKTDIKLYKSEN